MIRILSFIVLTTLFLQGNALMMAETYTYSFANYPSVILSDAIAVGGGPVAVDDDFETQEDTPLISDVSLNDAQGPFIYTIDISTAYGTLILNTNGSFTYTPNTNYNGTDSFTYSVCDALTTCDTAIVVITITSVNDYPTTTDMVYDVEINESITANASTAILNPDNHELFFSLLQNASHGNVVINDDGLFTYTPENNYVGQDFFTYNLCVEDNTCSTGTITFIVVDSNDSPVVVDDVFTGDEDFVLVGDVSTNDFDPDGGNLIFSIISGTGIGLMQMDSDGSFEYFPADDFHGQVTYLYTACDETNHCSIGNITITILPVNDPPTIIDDFVVGEQNGVVSYSAAFNDMDVDGDVLEFALVSSPMNGTLIFNLNGTFIYTPNANFFGQDSFVYEGCDAEFCESATVYLIIDQTTSHPIAVDDNYETNQGVGITGNFGDNDITDDAAVFQATNPGSGTLIFTGNGAFSYVPSSGFYGTDTFSYTVCNADNECDSAVVTIIVHQWSTIPVALDDHFTVQEDGFLFGNVSDNDNDADGDLLVYSVDVGVNYGTLIFNSDGTFTYTPNPNFYGTDIFVYVACDDDGNCDAATVTIVVTSVNDTPVANDDTYTTEENVSVSGFVGNNDSDVDDVTLIYNLIDSPLNGTVVLNSDGTFVYSPNLDFFGIDTFTYSVCDDEGLCDTATVTIIVNEGAVLVPVAVIDQYTTNEDEVLSGDVSLNDINLNGYIYSIFQNPSNGTVIMDDDGTFVYTPNPDFNGFDEFIYQACDLIGTCYTASVNIIIVPMPDDDLMIPLGFSPNGDGTNDTFAIENIDSYPNNKLTIFNRWGNVVFEKAPFTSSNSWNGTTDTGAVAFGSMVPEGTYFYVLDTGPSSLNAGKSEKKSGYIVVKYESK